MEEKKINVVYFFRKPFAGYFSIEELFGFIKSALPESIESTSYYLKRHSKGLKQRLLSCIEVMDKQGDINHITGDVHFISFFMRKSRTVLTIHDLEVLKRLKGIQRFIIKLFWFTIPAQRVKYITVISGFTKQELLKVISIDPEKVVVIHNSISPDIKFTPKPFNSDKPNILHVGTAHNKNLERLIEAIDGLNVKLTVLGQLKDHHLELLRNHDIEYENYFSLPYSHVIKQYQEADIVSFVSLYEGFGLPIIEANAIGRPVITSDCTSMPEVAGNAALIVDPYDVHKIRQGIISIINDNALRNILIENGRINVERFKPSFIAGKYADLYLKMMKS